MGKMGKTMNNNGTDRGDGMNYKYNQELPTKVEKELDVYIERIKAIQWFKPQNIDKATIDKQINVALKAFGVEASIEYRTLKTPNDWDAARDAARGAALGAARGAAWGAADLLASHTPKKLKYAEKYPNGNFIQLIPLWEAGLYPCGVIDSKFICYVPEGGEVLLEEAPVNVESLDVVINGVVYVPREGL